MSKRQNIPAEPKRDDVSAIVPLLPYQRAAVADPARFTHARWSRQTGKSFTKSLRRLVRGAIGRKRLQVLLSAGERQSRELMDKVRMHVQALKMAASFRDDHTFEGTTFKTLELTLPIDGKDVRIIALPANPMTARGFTGDVFLDEFAMHKDDRAIWAALFPTVMRGDGELDIASTPLGREGVFYELDSNPEFSHSTVTIHDAIADGLKADAEQLRRALGDDDLWRREFICEFVDEAAAFLTYEMITAIEDDRLAVVARCDGETGPLNVLLSQLATLPKQGTRTLGVDVGRQRDLTVLWVLEQVGNLCPTLLVAELSKCPFRTQREAIDATIDALKIDRVSVDATGLGMQLAEELVVARGSWMVDAVTFTAAVKDKLAGQLRVKVEDRSIRVPADARIREDWHSIQKTVTTGGTVRYLADRTGIGHADRFWAATLAVDALATGGGGWDGRGLVGAGMTAKTRSWSARDEGSENRAARKRQMMGV